MPRCSIRTPEAAERGGSWQKRNQLHANTLRHGKHTDGKHRREDGFRPQRRWISSAEKNFFVRRGKSFSLRTSSALLRSVFPVPPGTLNLNDLRKQETARGRAVLVPPASAPPHRPRTVRQLRKRSKRSAHTAKRRNFVPVKKAQHDQTPYCTGHEDSRRRHELCRTQ